MGDDVLIYIDENGDPICWHCMREVNSGPYSGIVARCVPSGEYNCSQCGLKITKILHSGG